MIVYVDSSMLARAYLADEPGHAEALSLLRDHSAALITGSWSLIEVSGALVRAARRRRGDAAGLLDLLDADLAADGLVKLVVADQKKVEPRALGLVRQHGIRAMDAWHLAVATIMLPVLAEPGEDSAFATRDRTQARVVKALGMQVW